MLLNFLPQEPEAPIQQLISSWAGEHTGTIESQESETVRGSDQGAGLWEVHSHP